MENDNQNKLGIETQPEQPREFYLCVKSRTAGGFVKELNKAQVEGYKPIWDSREIKRDTTTEPVTIIRTVMCYDTEATGMDGDEKSKRMEIIDLVDKSESYLYRKRSLMEDRENYLLLNTPWDDINLERKDEGLPKISNEKQRTAYLSNDKQLKVLKDEVQEATSWLKLVKEYSTLHELPVGKAPWVVEEEKATAQEEAESLKVKIEKVRNTTAQEAE